MNSSPREKLEIDLSDRPCGGRSTAVVNGNKVKQFDTFVTDDRRKDFARFCENVQVSTGYT